MSPTNLTECLQWLDTLNLPHKRDSRAFMAYRDCDTDRNFYQFVAGRCANFLRSHLAQSPLREAPAPLTVPGPADRRALMEIAKEMNRASRKSWLGHRPHDELMSLLKGWAGGINDVALAIQPQPEAAPASRFLSGDSHGRSLSHDEGGYTYTRGGKTLFQASHGSGAIDLWPDATTEDMQALIFALGGALLALAAVPAPVGLDRLQALRDAAYQLCEDVDAYANMPESMIESRRVLMEILDASRPEPHTGEVNHG